MPIGAAVWDMNQDSYASNIEQETNREIPVLSSSGQSETINELTEIASSCLDGVNGILMQQEPNSPKQDYWNQRAIASLANSSRLQD